MLNVDWVIVRLCVETFQADQPPFFPEDSIPRLVTSLECKAKQASLRVSKSTNCASNTVTKRQAFLAVMYTGNKPMHHNYNQYTPSFQVWYYIFWSHLDVFLHFWCFITAYCVFGYIARRSESSVITTQQFVRGKWVIFWFIKYGLLYIQSYSHRGDIWSIKYTLCQLTGNILRSYIT
jgi:hypothetical protein